MAEIEYVLLADHAEAVNGKLYVSGAGWTDYNRAPTPAGAPAPPTHFGIGVSTLIPWTETNRRHHMVLRIESEDGDPVLGTVETDLEMGRPPGLPPGSDQRAVLALNADIQFPTAGGYRIVAELGEQVKTVSFRINERSS
jgi:uncharacterized protein DUF6941